MRIRTMAEREIGTVTDAEYKKALPLAKRKQKDLHRRFGGCTGRQYLALLVGEAVTVDRMTRLCEEARPAKGKGSINDYHIESASVGYDTTPARICQEEGEENYVQRLLADTLRSRLPERA